MTSAALGPLNDVNTTVPITPYASVPAAYTYLIGRVNSARDTYVCAIVFGGYITLAGAVGGGLVSFASSAPLSLAAGGVAKLILGDPSSSSSR